MECGNTSPRERQASPKHPHPQMPGPAVPVAEARRSPTAAFVVKWVWMNGILRFDRTPVARLVSCAATFGSAALGFDYLSNASQEFEILPFSALALPFLGTLVAAVVQNGAPIFLRQAGVH